VARLSKRRRQEAAQAGTPTVIGPSGPSRATPASGAPQRPARPQPGPQPGVPTRGPSGVPSRGPSGRPGGSAPSRYRTQRVTVSAPWWQSPWAWGGGLTGLVVVVVVVILLVSMAGAPAATPSSNSNALQPVPASVLSAVTGVSTGISNSIGSGGVSSNLQTITPAASPLSATGSPPQIVFVGAEYCPYCAAERWSLVIAFSRFGKFTNLHITMSDSEADDFPDTHTFSFYGASYTSSYLKFESFETANRSGDPLQTPTAEVSTLLSTYDTAPYSSLTDGIPFVDFNNKYVVSGSGVDPALLQGLTWQQIASDLTDTSSSVGQAIIGNANWITAGICSLTGNQPASVCDQSAITTLEGQLGSS